MTTRKLVPLQDLLRRLTDNSGLSIAEINALPEILSKCARELGVQAGDLHVVEVTDDRTKSVSYDLGFLDPRPESRGDLITLRGALARDWTPPNKAPEEVGATKKSGEEPRHSFSSSAFTR